MTANEPANIERRFPKDLASLAQVFQVVDGFTAGQRVSPAVSYAVRFAVEEVFTNMVKYNPNGEDVVLALERSDQSIIIRFADVESTPFDITAVSVDVNRTLEERRPGGLGLFLLRKMMDEVTYVHDGTRSLITMTKHLEPSHV